MPDSFVARLQRHPRYQQAVKKRLAAPSYVRAIPDTRDITQAYGGEQARVELAGERHKTATDLGEQRLDIQREGLDLGRERLELGKELYGEEVGLRRAKQDVARSQGRIATGIGIAGLGLEGLASVMKIQDANKQTAAMDSLVSELGIAAKRPGASPEAIRLWNQARVAALFRPRGV